MRPSSPFSLVTVLALGLAQLAPVQGTPEAGKPVAGKYLGNGKPADLKFVYVAAREPFNDKPAIRLIFSEKDPAQSKKPDFDASFGKLGSALVLSVDYEGGIFGCEVCHTALEKSGFSSVGRIRMEKFAIADGKVTGHVTTGGQVETFGETWDVDLTFTAPAPASKSGAAPAPAKPSPPAPPKKEPEAPAGPAILVKDIPLPNDAAGVQFKAIVKQVELTTSKPVKETTAEVSSAMKESGWKEDSGSLRGPTNSILNYSQGAAKLKIMVMPSGAGSLVRYFVDGLDWTGAGN